MSGEPIVMDLPTSDGESINLVFENGSWRMGSEEGAGQEAQLQMQLNAVVADNQSIKKKIAKCESLIQDLREQQTKLTQSQCNFLGV